MNEVIKPAYSLGDEIYITPVTVARITGINARGKRNNPNITYELSYMDDGVYRCHWMDQCTVDDINYQMSDKND